MSLTCSLAPPPHPAVLSPAQELCHPATLLPENVTRAEPKDKESNIFQSFKMGFKTHGKFVFALSESGSVDIRVRLCGQQSPQDLRFEVDVINGQCGRTGKQ